MFLRLLVVFLLLAGTGFSQSFTFNLDGYYQYNFNKPSDRINDLRAFDINHNEFSLNYAELVWDQTAAPVGFRIDVGFGDTAAAVHAFEPATGDFYLHLQQAYVTANKGGFTVDFGKWVTPIGAEVIETKDNWNYSRGILFTWGIPFYHFGVKTTYVANDLVTVGANLSNGWNNVKDNNEGKTVGFLLSLTPGPLTFTNQYMVGDEQAGDPTRQLYDGILSVNAVPDKLDLMVNYDYGMDRTLVGNDRTTWQGVAFYARIIPVEKLRIVPRYEWFDDRDGFMTGTAQNLESFTMTGQILLHDSTSLWTEYRRDWSDSAIFTTDTATNEDDQNTWTMGLTYTFNRAAN